jgi:NTE family protein
MEEKTVIKMEEKTVIKMEEKTVIKMEEHNIIKEICLSGACNRGICYVGCLKKFEEMKILKLEKILGVSIGSFIAACHIIGYTPDELLRIIMNKNMDNFKDFTFDEQGAILKGEKYKEWVSEVLSVKVDPNITMKDLFIKTGINLIITTTCIFSSNEKYREGIIYISHEHTPDMPLIVAINSSMAFPLIFPPISYDGAKFIDGGVLDNIPLGLVPENTLNLRVSFKPIDSSNINNPISYVGKIFELISKRYTQLKKTNNENIIYVLCEDFNMIDFEMSIDDKITLYKRGYTAAEKYLNGIH